ncbi:MAG: preprotein translocase subunit SecE [Christensenellales bacterium]
MKETFSELKKVTWPSFGEVVKQTGIVLVVVLAFLVVLIGFDTVSARSISCS